MPKNNKQKRSGKRGARGQSGQVQAFGSRPLLPANRVARLAYAELIGLTEAVAGSGVSTSFSLNSIYDPNSGGVGKQPVGFDQIATMYGQFRVLGCRVKLTFANFSNQNTMVGMFGTYQPAVPADPAAWLCQPYGLSAPIEALGSKCTRVLVKRFDIPTVLGLAKAQYMSDMDFVGTPSGNPTRQAYLMVHGRSMTTTVASFQVYVQMEFDVMFSQPLALNTS